MGGVFSDLFHKLFNFQKEKRILMLGLDAAGKTTMLYKLHLGEVVSSIPTIGFNVEEVQYRKVRMTIWDIGGQDKIRVLWKHYFQGTDMLIFVIDSADTARIEEAKTELWRLLNDVNLTGVPLLVFANKQDLPTAKSVSQITAELNLHHAKDRKWFIQSCSATAGEGLYEGLDWMHETLLS